MLFFNKVFQNLSRIHKIVFYDLIVYPLKSLNLQEINNFLEQVLLF